ncbi:helix-turn-helix domain-containing protein [Paenibacillus koleovorans]|uniref:helix-turn-helix domain-containing protein n=1 Tax=Paenibacillus koleovorans TaxID=121608 RepID=UPI000FDC6241|nr:AraC family transcriptional regulator [Paenibacillus koleovorans]
MEQSKLNVFSRMGLKDRTSSLFIRLLVSFLVVISLLVAFILFSVMYYRGDIKEELIKYNTLNLKNTTDSYESLFELIHNSILTFSLQPNLKSVEGDGIDYLKAVATMQDSQFFLANRLLYLDNIFLLYKDTGFALEKGRGTDIQTMFGRYYQSPDYSSEFWSKQFQEMVKFRVFPASTFAELDRGNRVGPKNLIPILVKNEQLPNFYMLAMADADSLYGSLHHSINDNFYILNERGEKLYSSINSAQIALPEFPNQEGFVLQDDHYYFYMKDKSGFTYINMIPDNTISAQVKWNFWFLLSLILTVAVSVTLSLVLSHRLNVPVKRIIDAIQKWNTPLPWQSGIKEFNIIHDKINDILQSSRDIHQDLSEKESLLRYFAYSNMLKKIRHNSGNSSSLITADRPFVLLLFQVCYKSALHRMEVEEERATSFIREYVNRIVSEVYSDSLTFQMENDQILSIVFTESDQQDPKLLATLDQIRLVLDTERDYCFLTICASGGTDDWNEAYRNGLELLKGRKFNEETQVMLHLPAETEEMGLAMSPSHEEEFEANMSNGNDALVIQLVKRLLAQLAKKDVSTQAVLAFADDIIMRTQKSLQQRALDTQPIRQVQARLPSIHTYEQLEELLNSMIATASQLLRERKEKRDHIIHFVYDYLEEHYEKDITLDAIADKLNISRSYLSTYFKEKTGIYFVDYVNTVRVGKAKKLLARPDIRIQDAASMVGYQNINSFNRMFKKFTGMTPSEFRKNEIV